MKTIMQALILATVLSSCATDPYVEMMQRNFEMIQQMPDGPAKTAALKQEIADIDQERQTRALEQIANPMPTPFPTPIQVQFVPYP
jgi:hypothetical protein